MAAGLMAAEISRVPDRGADVRGSASTPGSSQTLSWCRGALQPPLSLGMLHTDCQVHMALVRVNITTVDITIVDITR